MTNKIFVSHSSVDRDAAIALSQALEEMFPNGLQTFNTSARMTIQAGDNWRDTILEAIDEANVIILWCTPAARSSIEVAFEIGAAFAYKKKVIPCAVHLAPTDLPWGLSQIQALTSLDTEQGWQSLARTLAHSLGYEDNLNDEPLLRLATQFKAPNTALSINCIGLTIEFKNTSQTTISDIEVYPAAGIQPPWLSAINGTTLDPGKGKIFFRQSDATNFELLLKWKDIAGISHQRRINIEDACQ